MTLRHLLLWCAILVSAGFIIYVLGDAVGQEAAILLLIGVVLLAFLLRR